MKKLVFIFILFLSGNSFSQINDSVVIINNYFRTKYTKERKGMDSIVANTKTDKRYFHTIKKEYFIDNGIVSKDFYLAEHQKQVNERFRPFKRLEYHENGQVSLVGNFYNGDGVLDSCKAYSTSGILTSSVKVVLDTLPPVVKDGVLWPHIVQKSYSIKKYSKEGILISHIYLDKNQRTEEHYSGGKLISTKTKSVKTKKQSS